MSHHEAHEAHFEARRNCDARGIVKREMKKLNMLTWGFAADDNLTLFD